MIFSAMIVLSGLWAIVVMTVGTATHQPDCAVLGVAALLGCFGAAQSALR